MRYQEAVRQFKKEIKPMIVRQYGPSDKIALITEWNNWTDQLAKSNEIKEKQYLTWPNPFEYRNF